jgi:DNA processing protein
MPEPHAANLQPDSPRDDGLTGHTGPSDHAQGNRDTTITITITSANANDWVPWLRLSLTPGIGPTTAKHLIDSLGSLDTLFDTPDPQASLLLSAKQLQALKTVPTELAQAIDTTQQWLDSDPRHSLVTPQCADYPVLLGEMDDPPMLLYACGQRALLRPRAALAMVGSRNASPQGLRTAHDFASSLASSGLCIVSGLALGIDGAAHAGALEVQHDGLSPTIAVVGTGLDRVYPRAHHALAQRIAQHGLLLSEFVLGTGPTRANFPKRNRIIAGLSMGTLVVEASLASGSLITAQMAADLGRDVFAIPGSIHSPHAKGCHALIRQGAKLVESVDDVLGELGWGGIAPGNAIDAARETDASHAAHATHATHPVLQALGFDPLHLDQLLERTGMSAAALQAQLFELELDGRVARLPGGLFQQIARA